MADDNKYIYVRGKKIYVPDEVYKVYKKHRKILKYFSHTESQNIIKIKRIHSLNRNIFLVFPIHYNL